MVAQIRHDLPPLHRRAAPSKPPDDRWSPLAILLAIAVIGTAVVGVALLGLTVVGAAGRLIALPPVSGCVVGSGA